MKHAIITAALLAASLTPAMADGVEDTLSVIGMAIAENECGLKPDPYIAQQTAQKSLAYTGLSREQYLASMSDAITFKTKQLYDGRQIGRFCLDIARIYGVQ